MPRRGLIAVVLIACATLVSAQQKPAGDLRIVVLAGEGAVNSIQQKTAVAPIVEVRDRNNLPVPGATVTFAVNGTGATFGSGSTLTVVTNAAGQATAAGLTPTAAGAVQVNVTAAFQGQLASAALTQTNFATAQAAAAAGAGGGTSGAGTAAGAGAGAGGGGIGLGTVAVIGGAVAGGAVAATQTGMLGGGDPGFIRILGTVYARGTFGDRARAGCTGIFEAQGTGATCYLDPLPGAVVSTSLDAATATTGADGNFDLTTTISRDHIDECRSYTITISAAGHPTYAVSWSGFSGNKQGNESRTRFILSPPVPTMIMGC